ncbi:nucleotidyltransferase domain-containing protein [Thermoflexus sp.]|uniref:nucleotidyltransferase domain-containing protein n=1 Tax=Thermoflexus sp. TaxID=1969742 RepID=UPI002ADD38A9|nr:nucleotidyltransferase domain-containing protein [Thermoflexus sp.]
MTFDISGPTTCASWSNSDEDLPGFPGGKGADHRAPERGPGRGARRGLRLSSLHGSFVEAEGFRDIDVAVFFDPLPERLWRREGELADQLERALRDAGFSFPIDVQALNEAPPAFRAAAIRPRQIPFCRDEDRRSEFEAAT